MYTELNAALAAARHALALAKAPTVDSDALIDSIDSIIAALHDVQGVALQAKEEVLESRARVEELEAEAEKRDEWARISADYELRSIATNVQAWIKVGTTGYLGDAVKLCPSCFSERRAIPLQASQLRSATGGAMRESIKCSACKFEVGFNGGFLNAE